MTGDPVNVAARLEQAAEPGEILVGERTVAAVRGAFEFGRQPTIEAKGKAGRSRCRRAPARAVPDASARGRRAARARSSAATRSSSSSRRPTRSVEQGGPRLVTILGDAGVGKSRLVRELWDRLSDEDPSRCAAPAAAFPTGKGSPTGRSPSCCESTSGSSRASRRVRSRALGDGRFLALTLGLDVAGGLHPLPCATGFQDAWVEFLERPCGGSARSSSSSRTSTGRTTSCSSSWTGLK